MRIAGVCLVVAVSHGFAAADAPRPGGTTARIGSTFSSRGEVTGAGFAMGFGKRVGRFEVEAEAAILDFNSSANGSVGHGLRAGVIANMDLIGIREDDRVLVFVVEGGVVAARYWWVDPSTPEVAEVQALVGGGLEIASAHGSWFIGSRGAFGKDDAVERLSCRTCRLAEPRDATTVREILFHTGWSVTW